MEAKGSKDSSPNKEKNQEKTGEAGTSERGAEIPYQQEGNPEKGTSGKQVQGQAEIPSQGSGDSLSLMSNKPATDVTPKQPSKEIDSPIAIITPLQFTKGNPDAGWIFNEELMPISVEELPPNEFFFDKKRKVVVRQELYQREGVVAKKFKIMTDGKAVKEEEFADEIAGTLGAYATANQYSVGTLKAQLKRKNLLISKLEAKVATAEANARDEVSKSLEQARIADLQEIEKLRSDLEQVRQSAQISQTQVSQQGQQIIELQSKLDVAENQVLDIKMFRSQAVEIRQKVLTAQQDLLVKVGTIQNHFQTIDQVLENISLREREAGAARVAFQDVVIATTKIEMVDSSKLSIAEQTRGNILLKVWEQNISESRGRANEVMNSCEETFTLINKSLLDLDKEGSAGTLGKINIAKHLLDIKENVEKEQAEISQISQVDMVQVDKWLVQPSLQLCSIITEDRQVGKRLPQLAKSCYTFEASNQAEPSRLIAQLVERCVICIEQAKGQVSGAK
jgi:hypothetical protein